MKLCLNMIVRNEEARIERCLKSVLPYLAAAVIVDTGSTDDTIRLMEKTFAEANIPYTIHTRPFINFKQARNAALEAARWSKFDFEYILLTDADMELVVEDKLCFANLTGPSYDIIQKAGTLSYHNRRIVNRFAKGDYLGVTHEYLDVAAAGCVSGAYFLDHADGSNRKDKFQRDIDLLLADLRDHPSNERSWFYLAQSYRDNGQPAQAAQAYRRRIEMGGWAEEVWQAKVNYATCLKDLGDEGGYVTGLLDAYNYRPLRAEALYDLARHFREKGNNYASLAFSRPGMGIPRTTDALFVSDYVYDTGLKEEFSICAFYDENQRDHGFRVANELALDRKGSDWSREQAKQNIYFYLKPLSSWVPSFNAYKLDFVPPDDYTPLNPSIALVGDQLKCIIRTVNYTMDADGRYLIKKIGEVANSENPIDTRNFMCDLHPDHFCLQDALEIIWTRPAPLFDLVTGLEDMRLSFDGHRMTFNACVRECNVEGWCEQFTGDIRWSPVANRWFVDEERRIPKEPRQNEKNWMPWHEYTGLEYVYRLGTIVDNRGNIFHETKPELHTDSISGGSQVIRFAGAHLAVVHEARYHGGKRYYWHRFALMDDLGRLSKLSMPFYLHEKQIEFVSGLCWHPDSKRLLISYGVRDEEAWVAEMDWHEVMEMFL